MPSALSAEQARKLADAEDAYSTAKAKMEEADRDRKALRKRYRPRLTLGQAVRAGGIEVVVKEVAQGASFRLAAYLAAGHRLTKEMRKHHTPASTREDWTVKRLPEGS